VGAGVFARNLQTGLETGTTTDGSGSFRIAARPGRYRVTATQTEFSPQSAEVEIAAGRKADVRLELSPAPLSQRIVVTGSREQELVENSVTKVDLIPRTFLRDSGYERVSDVLSEETGVITRSGSSGDRSETQIQGIDSRQSLILIDGYPVIGSRGIKRGILNMDRQSTGRLDRIEVVKGAASALHGSDAIGGVINMITRQPVRKFDLNLTASAGSFDAVDLRGDGGFFHKGWHGFFDVERHKRNPYDLTPESFDTTSSGYRRYDYLGKFGRDFSDRFKVNLFANAFDNQDLGNLVGELGPSVTTTNDSAQNYGTTIDVGLAPLTQLTFRGYYGKYDENSFVDLASSPNPIDETANLNERLYRLESTISQVLGTRQLLQGGVEWSQNQYRGFNRVLGDGQWQQIRMVDGWFNDRIQAHERLTLTLGGRLNSHSLYGTHLAPRVGTLFRVTDNLQLRASWGQGFRAPDLGQLYYRFLNPTNFYQVIGNPNLQPETSSTIQAGIDYRFRRVRFAGNYFRNDIKNFIQSNLIGTPRTPEQLQALLDQYDIDGIFNPALNRLFFIYSNLQNVYTSGIETKVEIEPLRNLLVSSGYTYLDARDKDTEAFLAQRHRHHGFLRFWWSTNRGGGFRTNLRGTYFSKWPVSATLTGNAYQIWDWYVAKPLKAGTEFYFAFDNLFDSTDPNLLEPTASLLRADPGRTFRVGLRWSLAAE
jgi:outer membrane receptor for ferrienterochelin and colicins